MISSKKLKRISTAIYGLMRANVLNDSISHNASAGLGQTHELLKYYIYIEICNTEPVIDYVYNTDCAIAIGRQVDGNTICIQDPAVSRKHACVYEQGGSLWIENVSGENVIDIRSGLFHTTVYAGEVVSVASDDVIKLGDEKFRMYLLQGPETVVN